MYILLDFIFTAALYSMGRNPSIFILAFEMSKISRI